MSKKTLSPVALVLHHFIVPTVDVYNKLKNAAQFHTENCKKVNLEKVETYDKLVSYLTKVNDGTVAGPDDELANVIDEYFTNLHAEYGQELIKGVQLESGLPLEAALPWAEIAVENLAEPTVEAFFDTTKIPATPEAVADAIVAAVEGEEVPVTAEAAAANTEAVQDQSEGEEAAENAETSEENAENADPVAEDPTPDVPVTETGIITAAENLPVASSNDEFVSALTKTVGVLQTSVNTTAVQADTIKQQADTIAALVNAQLGKATVEVKSDTVTAETV